MASKKKTKEYLRRSKAAKKGWETRRKNEALKRNREKGKNRAARKSEVTRQNIKRNKKRDKKRSTPKKPRKRKEKRKKDTGYYFGGIEVTEEEITFARVAIVVRREMSKGKDSYELDEIALRLARELGYSKREIFTLFYSPEKFGG